MDNISFCLPTWDIDNTIEKWRATIVATEEIINLLDKENVSKSVFLKWSGNGAHLHRHHKAFSPEPLRKINPLDAAYAIVEYVNTKLHPRYLEIARRYGAQELKIENEMDLQRVFTSPLSLHRSQNRVAVCLSSAGSAILLPNGPLQNTTATSRWDRFEIGEADQLTEKARRIVGAYPLRRIPRSTERKGSHWLTKK